MASGRKEDHQDAPTQTPQRLWGGLLRRIPAPCKTSVGGSGRKGGITKSSNTEKHNVSQGHPPDRGHGLAHARWGPTISPNDRNRLPQRARANKAVPKPQQPAPDQDRRRARGRENARPRPALTRPGACGKKKRQHQNHENKTLKSPAYKQPASRPKNAIIPTAWARRQRRNKAIEINIGLRCTMAPWQS